MANKTPWFKNWFGREYLEVYSHRTLEEARSHISFIQSQFSLPASASIFDMTCGAGRHLLALREQGFTNVIGADLSTELLEESRQLLGSDANLIQYDMRCFPFKNNSFDLILNFFTSFGYFKTEDENQQVIKNVRMALKDDGHFIFDYMNPVRIVEHLTSERKQDIDGGTVVEQRSYYHETKRVENKIFIERGSETKHFIESVRVYQEEELNKLFTDAGLCIKKQFGDFDGSSFNRESKRLILIAKADVQI